MKHTCLFWSLTPVVITVLLSSTITSVFSSTSENNTVLQQAQRSLDANQKQLATVSPEPVPNVVPSAVQGIQGTSMVQGVFFTWVIISSDNEVSINLRYVGDGATPPVSVAATALTKSGEDNPVTMKGSLDLNAGWSSPSTVDIKLNGGSSFYDSTSINVVASPLGSSPTVKAQTDNPATFTNIPKISIPKNADIYLETKLSYNDNTLWYFPPNALINFTKANRICPVIPCGEEFQDVSLMEYPGGLTISGILKIQDKKTLPNINNWKLFDMTWLSSKIINVIHDIKTNQTTNVFSGQLDIDSRDTKLTTSYKIDGIFQTPSGFYKLTGKEIIK